MTDAEDEFSLAADDSLENPADDRLGYDKFANHLSEVILSKTPIDEFIIGIYGDWGSGKSTVLNFIKSYLNEESNTDKSPIVVEFNPWWFSDQHDLFEKYLQELAAALGADRFKNLRKKLSTYATTFSKILTGPVVEAAIAQEGAKKFGDIIDPDTPDLATLKDDISSELEDSDEQIVVLIDDIDRLTQKEIQQMFRLVKSVADFPNITYILAFDHDVVVQAINDSGMDGDDYLNKIVQLPVHLPEPQKHAIQDLFYNNIEEAVGPNWEPRVEERWTDIFQNGVRPLLNTPRDAIRLSNAINISHSMFDPGEINVTDLIGIEAIRLFYPDVYKKIRTQPDRFVGVDFITPAAAKFHDDENEETDEYYDVFQDQSEPEIEPLQTLLGHLFPKCAEKIEKQFPRELDTYRKRRRICHAETYRFYFRLAIPQEGISTHTIKKLIQIQDPNEFCKKITDLNKETVSSGRTKAHVALLHLSEYTKDIDEGEVPSLIKGLFRISDNLLKQDDENDDFLMENQRLLNQLIRELLSHLDPEQLSNLLCDVLESNDGLYLKQKVITTLSKQHGMFDGKKVPENQQLLNKDQVITLQKRTADQIATVANSGILLELERPFSIFSFWHQISSEEATNWLKTTIKDDDGLLKCINRLFIEQDPARWKANPEYVDELIDLEKTLDRLEEINSETLNQEYQNIIDIFIKGKNMHENGRNPSGPIPFKI